MRLAKPCRTRLAHQRAWPGVLRRFHMKGAMGGGVAGANGRGRGMASSSIVCGNLLFPDHETATPWRQASCALRVTPVAQQLKKGLDGEATAAKTLKELKDFRRRRCGAPFPALWRREPPPLTRRAHSRWKRRWAHALLLPGPPLDGK